MKIDQQRLRATDGATTSEVKPPARRSGWEAVRLGDLASFYKGSGLSKSDLSPDGRRRCIHYGELFTTYGERIVNVVHGTNRQEKFFYSAGNDVLMPTSDVTPNGLATASCIRQENVILGGDILVIRASEDVLDGEFLAYVIEADRSQVMKLVNGTTVYHLYGRDMANFCFNVPNVKEQRAIAAVLSDVDESLGALGALIAKKRDIKKGTVQELITGKTRLSAFAGEWETIRLGDVASFFKGSGLSKGDLSPDGAKRCIHYGELFTTYGPRIADVVHGTNREGHFFHSVRSDVLMPTSDVTPNGLATASCIKKANVIIGGDVMVIRAPEDVLDGEFLAYAIKSNRDQVMKIVNGTTVFHLYGRDMAKFSYMAPCIREQRAIVDILADMDAEIEALEERRKKTAAIKQGMVRELLTGRKHLV